MQVTSKLAAWIAQAGPEGRTRKDITTGYFGGNTKADTIQEFLDELITAGHIVMTRRPRPDGRPGRPTEVYTTADPPTRANLTNLRTQATTSANTET